MPRYFFLFTHISLFLSFIFFPSASAHSTVLQYDNFNNVQFVRNYDGDSITFNIPDTPAIVGDNIVIRLRGVDTPELRTKSCSAEKEKAKEAKQLVYSLLSRARNINLHRIARGKYFRMLADVEFDGQDLASILLNKKLAVQYSGGTRQSNWCPESNRRSETRRNSSTMLPPKVSGVYVWPPPPVPEKDTTDTKYDREQ